MSEIVYIFTNPAMPGFIKIGMTTRDDVRLRLKELSNPTGVPMPFECPYAAEVRNATEAEKAFHNAFEDYRLPRREFFKIAEGKVIALLKQMALSDKTPDTQKILDEITSPEDKSAQAAANRTRIKFSEIGIMPGEELTFKDDPTKKCKVLDDKQSVEYEGETFYSLADLARELCDYENQPNAAPVLFTYQGKTLSELRKG